MKFYLALAWAYLVTSAAAFGVRGAAERAFFYAVYIMEETYKDASQFTIAKGCVGTRTGARGQEKRCLLSEFLDYLWAEDPPAPGHDPVPKPNKDLVIFPGQITSQNVDKHTPKSMTTWINSIKKIKKLDASGAPISTGPNQWALEALPEPQYTGFLATDKLIDDAEDYYDGMRKVGESALKAKQAYKGAETTLTDDEKKILSDFQSRVGDAARRAYNYRLMDEGTFHQRLIDAALKEVYKEQGFRAAVVKKAMSLPPNPEAFVAGVQELDKDKTAANWARVTGDSKETILGHIEDALNASEKTGDTAVHQKALNCIKRATDIAETVC